MTFPPKDICNSIMTHIFFCIHRRNKEWKKEYRQNIQQETIEPSYLLTHICSVGQSIQSGIVRTMIINFIKQKKALTYLRNSNQENVHRLLNNSQ